MIILWKRPLRNPEKLFNPTTLLLYCCNLLRYLLIIVKQEASIWNWNIFSKSKAEKAGVSERCNVASCWPLWSWWSEGRPGSCSQRSGARWGTPQGPSWGSEPSSEVRSRGRPRLPQIRLLQNFPHRLLLRSPRRFHCSRTNEPESPRDEASLAGAPTGHGQRIRAEPIV